MVAKKTSTKSAESRPLLVQIYFVLASLIGLILIVISCVNISRLALNEVLGVRDYPESPPYLYKDPNLATTPPENVTAEERQNFDQWQKDYTDWQQKQKDYNSSDQNRRRQIAESLAMLVVGIPVFAFHAPYVFKRA
ncbi:MAG: hypothetical protein ABI425_05640 [Patescibacteria group bacterium]